MLCIARSQDVCLFIEKLSKLVNAYQNYSLPKLARFCDSMYHHFPYLIFIVIIIIIYI